MIEFHGNIHYQTAKNIYEKTCWGLIILTALIATSYLTYLTLTRYAESPTSVASAWIYEANMKLPDVLICSSQVFNVEDTESHNMSASLRQYLQNYFVFSSAANRGLQKLSGFQQLTDHREMHMELLAAMNKSGFTSFEQFVLFFGGRCQDMLLECWIEGTSFNCCEYTTIVAHSYFNKCFALKNLSAVAFQTSPGASGGFTALIGTNTKYSDTGSTAGLRETWFLELSSNITVPTHTHIPLKYSACNYVSIDKVHLSLSNTRSGGCLAETRIPKKLCAHAVWAEATKTICNCTEFGFKTTEQIFSGAAQNVCMPLVTAKCLSNKGPKLYPTLLKLSCMTPNCYEEDISMTLTTVEIRQKFVRLLRNESNPLIDYTQICIYYNSLGYRSLTEFQSVTLDYIFSAVGGNVGLFLGASVISFVQLGMGILQGIGQLIKRVGDQLIDRMGRKVG